ncbi:MAG: hypothetical protein AB1567_11530 [bacterium]
MDIILMEITIYLARLVNNVTGSDGIDTFAETCIHEGQHQSNYFNWDNIPGPGMKEPDIDGDELPDWYEDCGDDGIPNTNDNNEGNGIWDPPGERYNLNNPYTITPKWDDEEDMCQQAEFNWTVGSADSEDWADPGHQSNK